MTDDNRPHDLRVDHLVGPLGIGEQPPRVSWKLPAGASVQHAYRIAVNVPPGTIAQVVSPTGDVTVLASGRHRQSLTA